MKTRSEHASSTKLLKEQKDPVKKYADLLNTGVKKNDPLGKYQPIFNLLKKQRDISIGIKIL